MRYKNLYSTKSTAADWSQNTIKPRKLTAQSTVDEFGNPIKKQLREVDRSVRG